MTLKEEKEHLLYIIQSIKQKKHPNGNLRIQKSHNCIQYLCVIDNKVTYIHKNDKEFVKALAQKKYDEAILKAAEEELTILKDCNERNENCLSDIYAKLSQEIKELITPYDIPDKDYVDNWLKTTYMRKAIEEGTKFIITSNGDKVRSKSESIIADKLYSKKIPYRYEQKHILHEQFTYRQIVFYPDFTILNPTSREEIIWEHFGLMSNEDYADNAVAKISLYNQNNYIQGKNLICTFESKNNPLQPYEIENIIKTLLL